MLDDEPLEPIRSKSMLPVWIGIAAAFGAVAFLIVLSLSNNTPASSPVSSAPVVSPVAQTAVAAPPAPVPPPIQAQTPAAAQPAAAAAPHPFPDSSRLWILYFSPQMLYGNWNVDFMRCLQSAEMGEEERAMAMALMGSMQMAITFDSAGNMTMNATMMGEHRTEAGSYRIIAVGTNSLTVETTTPGAEGEEAKVEQGTITFDSPTEARIQPGDEQPLFMTRGTDRVPDVMVGRRSRGCELGWGVTFDRRCRCAGSMDALALAPRSCLH